MKTEKIYIEGLEFEIEYFEKTDAEAEKKRLAAMVKEIRKLSGLERKEFSAWLDIPYRTMQEWELGRRAMPEYVLRLMAYKVYHSKVKLQKKASKD